MIPNEVIEEIRSRVNIVQVVGEVVKLKRSGRNHLGLCPFHAEKTPSFSVSEDKQLYYCFGCGEGGSVFNFISRYYNLAFPQVLEQLASNVGVDLSRYEKDSEGARRKNEQRERMLAVLDLARDSFYRSLLHSERAQAALAYAKGRGLDRAVIERWQIGYAPQGDKLAQYLEAKNVDMDLAVEVGLVRSRTKPYRDYFSDRLMFPIFDADGSTLGFGGRSLKTGQNPKYVNSPESPLFSKRAVLYGLHRAKDAIRANNQVIVVEGYTDVIALHEAGISHAVAALGTAFSRVHAQVLKKYTSEVVLVFDNDSAGQAAAQRAMEPLLAEGLNIKIAFLSEAKDPDDFIKRRGKISFMELIDAAPLALNHFIEQRFNNVANLAEKAKTMDALAQIISQIKDPFLKDTVVGEVAKQTGLDKVLFTNRAQRQGYFRQAVVPGKTTEPLSAQSHLPSDVLSHEQVLLLRMAAENGVARTHLSDVMMDHFSISQQGLVEIWLERLDSLEIASPAACVDCWEDEPSKSIIGRVFFDESLDFDQDWQKVWSDCVGRLRQKKLKQVTQKLRQAEIQGNDVEVRNLFVEVEQLKRNSQSVLMK